MIIETFDTEGVLMLVNTSKCKQYYADKEFEYSYPEGLSELIKQGIIHIITTTETVENLNFVFDKAEIDLNKWAYKESYNYLDVENGEPIQLISHAAFTQMCSSYKGDLDAYIENDWRIRNLLNREAKIEKQALEKQYPIINLPSGLNKVSVYTNTFAGGNFLPEFTFLFEKLEAVDLSKVTLNPIEFEG